MKMSTFVLACVSAGALMSAPAAASIIYNGAGGTIPASGTGGGGDWPNGVLPGDAFESTITVNDNYIIDDFFGVQLSGLQHTFAGDLHAVLTAPSGVRLNIFHRPGFTGAGFGSGGDFVGGDFGMWFVEAGVHDNIAQDGSDIVDGVYSQDFGNPNDVNGQWTDGTAGITNNSFSSLNGTNVQGDWTLTIYDWAGGDSGSLAGWAFKTTPVPAPGAAALLGVAALVGVRSRRRA